MCLIELLLDIIILSRKAPKSEALGYQVFSVQKQKQICSSNMAFQESHRSIDLVCLRQNSGKSEIVSFYPRLDQGQGRRLALIIVMVMAQGWQ